MLTAEEKNTYQVSSSQSMWKHAIRLDWLGQMIASVLWAASVFAYGISSTGDVLQLCAALAWMIANLASLMSHQSKNEERIEIRKNGKQDNGV